MRDVVCPICNCRASTVLYGAKLPADFAETAPPSPYSAHYQINRCGDCGLTYSSPVMDDRGVSRLYEEAFSLRRASLRGLQMLRVANIPVTIPVGNIGIVARRPAT
jgi:hypothetical protein